MKTTHGKAAEAEMARMERAASRSSSHGDNLLHTKGTGQSTPAPKVHREPNSTQVKTK